MLWNFLSLFFLSLVLPWGTLAHSQASVRHSRFNTDLAKRHSGDIQKRFEGARWTWYAVGLGACGRWNIPTDFIVAMNTQQFGYGYPGPNCFKTITMTFNGKTTRALVTDKCPGCPYGGLDLSIGLFNFFASQDVGVLYGTWSFDDGSAGGSWRA